MAPVIFKDGCFGVDVLERAAAYSRKGFYSFDHIEKEVGDKPDQFEIIGDIYSTPELLEGK